MFLILQNCAMLKVCNGKNFYLKGKLRGRAWKCLFYGTKDKKTYGKHKNRCYFYFFLVYVPDII